MNDQYCGPRISPAEVLLERPKRTQKAAETYGFRTSLYSSGVVNAAAIPGIVTVNYMRLPVATAVLHPCKEAALFDIVSQMAGSVFRAKSLNMFCD